MHISQRTIFKWGADIEQSKVSDIPSRNSETNNFQNNNNNNNYSILYKMTEENIPGSKYVNVLADNIIIIIIIIIIRAEYSVT
jgi:hypothetical protein